MNKIDKKLYGVPLALVILLAILEIGVSIPRVPTNWKDKKDADESFPPLIPTENPAFVNEQLKTRDVSRVARRMEEDYIILKKVHDSYPKFKPPADDHLTPADIQKYISATDDYASALNSFKDNTVGPHPGVFRTFAVVGMLGGYNEVLRMRALVNNKMTEDEYEWIKTRIMEAALFSVDHKMSHDPMTPEQKEHLTTMYNQLLLLSRVTEMSEEGELIDHTDERFKPLMANVPQTNIRVFLDNYSEVYYTMVNFKYPTTVEFDRDAIFAAASKNPP